MDITAPTISLKKAAYAAGLSTRWLRAALSDGHMVMLGQTTRQAGGWNYGAPVDVYRLLVVRKLLGVGLNMAEAMHVLDAGLDPHLGGLCGCGISLPVSFLLNRLEGAALYVTRDDETNSISVRSGPAGDPPGSGLTICLDLGNLAADAIRRLEAAHTSTAANDA